MKRSHSKQKSSKNSKTIERKIYQKFSTPSLKKTKKGLNWPVWYSHNNIQFKNDSIYGKYELINLSLMMQTDYNLHDLPINTIHSLLNFLPFQLFYFYAFSHIVSAQQIKKGFSLINGSICGRLIATFRINIFYWLLCRIILKVSVLKPLLFVIIIL